VAVNASKKGEVMSEPYLLFAGIDWATQKHAVCVVDVLGKRVREVQVEHSEAGLERPDCAMSP
jgi:hypothetical protein